MSIVTQMIIAERYGVRLNMEQLADALGLKRSTVYSRVAEGTLGIMTYVDCGKRWADFRDVAAHFDQCREDARQLNVEMSAQPMADVVSAACPAGETAG